MRMPLANLRQRFTITDSLGVAIWVVALLTTPVCVRAEKVLGFTAEHLIEAQMDARYLALPEIPMQADDRRVRFDFGVLAASGGLLTSSAAMLGVQRFTPLSSDTRWAFGIGAFLDLIRFDGSSGKVSIDPIFARDLPFAVPLDVQVLDVAGDALHAGLTFSLARHVSETWTWQVGVALELYDIDAFNVAFRATAPNNFDGAVDYAGSYNSVTPYFTIRHLYPTRSERFIYSSRLLVALPLPHRGFHGRVSGPGFDIENDSDAVGAGRHIPDGFAGLGFAIESTAHRWRIDLGASLWLLLIEPQAHAGVDPPLFVHFSVPVR